jgi:hypothetical protein
MYIISEFVIKFENEFKIIEVDLKIQEFADKCRIELNGIKFKDSIINKTDDESKIKDGFQLFTDKDACKEWLNTDRTNKILLKTDGKKLTVKINSKSQTYKDKEEITFVINVLKISFEEASQSELVFWQAYGELKDINVKLTKDNLEDF